MKSPEDHIMLLDDTKDDNQRSGFKNFSFNFDSAAGILYTVDVTKPVGEKLTILSMTDGRPFDLNKEYRVAVNSWRTVDERSRHSGRTVEKSYYKIYG
jgi:2',3'-cyclic-nucleotide 2'-phosphodiesterase/3'-nucleotidase